MQPRGMGQELRIGIAGRLPQMLMKYFAYLFFLLVYTGQYDMARRLPRQLDDTLPQIGIDYGYPVLVQEGIELTFFGEHGLALDHLVHLTVTEDGKHDRIVLRRIRRPVNNDTIAHSFLLELPQIFAEIREHIVLDPGGRFAQYLPLGQPGRRFVPLLTYPPKG